MGKSGNDEKKEIYDERRKTKMSEIKSL